MHDVWWVNAFVGRSAGGNSTCVVLEESECSTAERAQIARSLRAPDTAFLSRSPNGGDWTIEHGHGRALNRGLLRLHAPPGSAEIAVGGAAEIVARGTLASPPCPI